jgi:hypothetical protein
MTIGIIAGEDIHGTTNGYLSNKCNGTGRAGRRASIGRSNKPGGSRV